MKRWHQDFKIAKRNWLSRRSLKIKDRTSVGYESWQLEPGQSSKRIIFKEDNQIGRFRKKDGHDCGLSCCLICHEHKFPWRKKTLKEINSERDFKLIVKEFYDHF